MGGRVRERCQARGHYLPPGRGAPAVRATPAEALSTSLSPDSPEAAPVLRPDAPTSFGRSGVALPLYPGGAGEPGVADVTREQIGGDLLNAGSLSAAGPLHLDAGASGQEEYRFGRAPQLPTE